MFLFADISTIFLSCKTLQHSLFSTRERLQWKGGLTALDEEEIETQVTEMKLALKVTMLDSCKS